MLKVEGYTQDEVLKVIDRVANKLAANMVFGFNERSDIKQEVTIFCLEALDSFDAEKGKLYSFLLISAKRQLINFKRDTFERIYPKCGHCEDGTCKLCFSRNKREALKKALFSGSSEGETPLVEDHNDDLLNKIDNQLPAELRSTYLKILSGHKVSHTLRQQLKDSIKEILYANQ